MKNFDIEQLERKNIYKAPDGFFAKIQQNVLDNTIAEQNIMLPKKEAKVFKLNWTYAIAAALAMIFGLGYFITNNDNESVQVIATKTSDNTITSEASAQTIATLPQKESTESLIQDTNEGLEVIKKAQQNNSTQKPTIAKVDVPKTPSRIIIDPVYDPVKVDEVAMDAVLTSLSQNDLAELSNDSGADVYLDLYN